MQPPVVHCVGNRIDERRSAQTRGVKERDKTEMSYIILYFVDFNIYKYNTNKRNSA